MNANAGDAEIHSLGLPPFAERLRPGIEIMCAGNRAGRIIRLVSRCVEENLDCIADDLCNRSFMRKDNIGPLGARR